MQRRIGLAEVFAETRHADEYMFSGELSRINHAEEDLFSGGVCRNKSCRGGFVSVSYTHLTLPTILLV